MTDDEINERAEKIKAIAEGAFGKFIGRDGDTVEIEIPADLSIGLYATWGRMGLVPINIGQTTSLVPRRVVGMNGNVIVCEADLVTTAFYRLRINLRS